MIRKKKILIYCILILIGVGLIAHGRLTRYASSLCRPQSEAEKLAELEAALIEVAATGKSNRSDSEKTRELPTLRPAATRPT